MVEKFESYREEESNKSSKHEVTTYTPGKIVYQEEDFDADAFLKDSLDWWNNEPELTATQKNETYERCKMKLSSFETNLQLFLAWYYNMAVDGLRDDFDSNWKISIRFKKDNYYTQKTLTIDQFLDWLKENNINNKFFDVYSYSTVKFNKWEKVSMPEPDWSNKIYYKRKITQLVLSPKGFLATDKYSINEFNNLKWKDENWNDKKDVAFMDLTQGTLNDVHKLNGNHNYEILTK